MKVDLTKKIRNLEGDAFEEIKTEGDKRTKVKVTLKDICVNALQSNDDKIDGNEKMKRFLFAEKLHKANKIDLTVDEVVKLKELIGKIYPIAYVGASYKLLEK